VSYLRKSGEGILLSVHAQPRASRTAIVGEHDGALKIAVRSPPVDGAANEALVEFLAEILSLPKRNIKLRSGESGRRKLFLLTGISLGDAHAHLARSR
jgi:uncharacterized protein (TIGR00251 family)